MLASSWRKHDLIICNTTHFGACNSRAQTLDPKGILVKPRQRRHLAEIFTPRNTDRMTSDRSHRREGSMRCCCVAVSLGPGTAYVY